MYVYFDLDHTVFVIRKYNYFCTVVSKICSCVCKVLLRCGDPFQLGVDGVGHFFFVVCVEYCLCVCLFYYFRLCVQNSFRCDTHIS